MAVVEMITYVKNSDNDEVIAMRSFLTDKEQKCLCMFRRLSDVEKGRILGRMEYFILKKFTP